MELSGSFRCAFILLNVFSYIVYSASELLFGQRPVQFGMNHVAHQFLALVSNGAKAQFLAFHQRGSAARKGFINHYVLSSVVLQYDVHKLI